MTKDGVKLDAYKEGSELIARSTEDELDDEIDEEAREPRVPISELRSVRVEAAKYRKQLRYLESKIEKDQKTAELANMEESDRLKAIAEEAEAKAKSFEERADTIAKRAAIINAASIFGFHNPKDAASIVDMEQIEVDNDGTVDDGKLNELVKSLAESKPYLIKTQQDSRDMAGFGPTNPPSSNWPKPKLRTKDQIDLLKQQSREVMRTGRMLDAIKLYNRAWEIGRDIKPRKENGGS